jgi:hypothetical protein
MPVPVRSTLNVTCTWKACNSNCCSRTMSILCWRHERERKKFFYWAFGKFHDAESIIVDVEFQILYYRIIISRGFAASLTFYILKRVDQLLGDGRETTPVAGQQNPDKR